MMATESYQVLARKWRPRQFDEVVGQDAVVRTLANALRQGRIAHAYCFSGIRGVGKTTVARLLAMGLNCHAADGPTAEPCGRCESCVEIEASRSMDVVELDAASQTGVDNIRELTEVTRYAPSRDRRRVFIIDEAHMLSASAFNALLKTLEEPPSHVVFVLATTEPSKILPTVLSRCQHYQFGRISQRRIVGHLRRMAEAEGVEVTDDSLALIATAADGSLRDAQSLLDKLIAFAGDEIDEGTVVELLGLVERVLLFRAADLIAEADVAAVLRFVNEMVESGVDLHQFAVDLLGHLRDLIVARSVPDAGEILHLPEADMARLGEQAERFALEDLDRAFHLLAAAEYRIKSAEQPRHHLEVALARLARLPHLEPLESLIATLRQGGDGEPTGGDDSSGRGGTGPAAGGSAAAGGSTAGRQGGPTASASASEASSGGSRAGTAGGGAGTGESPGASPEPGAGSPPSEPGAAGSAGPGSGEAGARDAAAEDPAPVISQPDTGATDPAAPAAGPEPEADDTAGDAAKTEDDEPRATSRALLERIQEQVGSTHPLVAGLLERTCGIELAGERILFNFPPEASVLSKRVESPEVLELLSDVSRRILGRRVVARVGIAAAPRPGTGTPEGSGPRPVAPGQDTATARAADTSPSNGAGGSGVGEPTRRSPREQPPPVQEPPADLEGPARRSGGRSGADPVDRQALMRRVENEPLVQEFVRALKGQITSVEEL